MNDLFPNLDACNPSLCFSGRIMRMSRIISGIFRKHIAPFGITNSQLSILFVTSKKEVVNQTQLVEILFLEKSSVNRNLNRLLESQLLHKIDARNFEVTTKGKTLLEGIVPAWQKAMREVDKILGTEGQHAFNKIYHKITS